MFKKKNIIILAAVLFVVLSVIIYTQYNKPHRNVYSEKPVISIKADDLFASFAQNEIEYNKKFLDKTIEIVGEISEINISNGVNPLIVFKNEEEFFGVSCSFNIEAIQGVAKLKVGDSVKVKGICKGYLSDVVLVNCIIVN